MNGVKQHFEAEAQEFERIILALIPGYAQMVEALVAALPFDSNTPIKVFDLGSGTGTVALSILRQNQSQSSLTPHPPRKGVLLMRSSPRLIA